MQHRTEEGPNPYVYKLIQEKCKRSARRAADVVSEEEPQVAAEEKDQEDKD